jgi:hypothetical protein
MDTLEIPSVTANSNHKKSNLYQPTHATHLRADLTRDATMVFALVCLSIKEILTEAVALNAS